MARPTPCEKGKARPMPAEGWHHCARKKNLQPQAAIPLPTPHNGRSALQNGTYRHAKRAVLQPETARFGRQQT